MFDLSDINNLLSVIPVGRNNAITARTIALRLRYPVGGNQVKTRQLIDFAIDNGSIILSSSARVPRGYWISDDANEVREYIRSLRNRANQINDRADNLRTGWNINNSNNQI